MFIKDMSLTEKKKIYDLLKEDGFVNVTPPDKAINSIFFRKGLRTYEILSTKINKKDPLESGLKVDFSFDEFLSKNYEHKSRHSVSFLDKLTNYGSIEEACEVLGWQLNSEGVINLTRDPDWIADLHAENIAQIRIGNLNHVIIDDSIYAGELSQLLAMGRTSMETLLSGTKILDYLNQVS